MREIEACLEDLIQETRSWILLALMAARQDRARPRQPVIGRHAQDRGWSVRCSAGIGGRGRQAHIGIGNQLPVSLYAVRPDFFAAPRAGGIALQSDMVEDWRWPA